MKHKRQLALNKLFNLFMIFALLLIAVACIFISENDISFGLGTGTVGLLFLLIPAILMPCCYFFDIEGVTICYLFLPNERYLWKNIHSITVTDDTSHNNSIFDLFFSYVFDINGSIEGKQRFYMRGHIQKSWRTKHLIEKYWDGTVTGYFFEDIKAWINKRISKKQEQIKQHLTDEIVPIEQEMREKVRELIKPYIDQALQSDLKLCERFVYITSNLDELKRRPAEGYTYTAIVEISHPGETDENRIIGISVDLLYVRLGKRSYRGVENKTALEELEFYLTDTLTEISKNGIESYCR